MMLVLKPCQALACVVIVANVGLDNGCSREACSDGSIGSKVNILSTKKSLQQCSSVGLVVMKQPSQKHPDHSLLLQQYSRLLLIRRLLLWF